jgi:integrase
LGYGSYALLAATPKMPLTDTSVRKAKPGSKPYKMHDLQGLFVLVAPGGGKWWRQKYRYMGKEKLLSLGVYPQIGLKEAREQRDAIRKQLAAGIDPSENRKALKAAKADSLSNSFEIVAREWLGKQTPTWSKSNAMKVTRRLEADLFPWLGKRPVSEIKAPELLKALRRVEERAAVDTAHRILQDCGRIFRYAVASGRAERDVAADLRGALAPAVGNHFASITDPEKVGALLRATETYQGTLIVKCALRLAPLVFLRPGELRKAEWAEFDLDKADWNIPASRMKIKNQGSHLVPLSRQAVKVLREIHPITGDDRFVFPSARSSSRPMSDNAVLAALRRMGFPKEEMSGHGFRAMARTILDEVLRIRPDYIEHQLGHAVKDPNGRAYNRTAHLPERRKMMQRWADYLDKLASGKENNDGRKRTKK